jgi:flagellar hook-associated protein 1 FlgK
VSGVSVDEESINLLAFQRAYQGSARFITVVDEMMQTLLGLVR